MPDILKKGYVIQSETSVLIPDTLADLKPSLPLDGEEDWEESEIAGEPPYEEEEDPLELARAEADECLRQAQEDSGAIVSQAQAEAEQLRRQALDEGRAEGAREKKAEIEEALQRLNALMDSLQTSLNRFFADYEEEIKDLAVAVAGKVIDKRISRDDMELAEMVKKAVASVKKADWIQVEVSEQLPMLVEYLQREFSQPEYGGGIEIVAKNGPPGSCVIQTPEGIVDASVSTQLENLKDFFSQAER